MKRLLIGATAGALAGTLLGFALGIFIYPFWFLNNAATEQLVQNNARVEIAKGEFIHANSSDPVHYGQGHMTLYNEGDGRKTIHLADDFQVGPGPAFHVYLVDHTKVRSKNDFNEAKKLTLAKSAHSKAARFSLFQLQRTCPLSKALWSGARNLVY